MKNKVENWTKELDCLATIAVTQPHAAHEAFTHGLSSKWSYLTRTVQGIGPLLQPLETVIRLKLIPALTGQPPPNDAVRRLLALPARLGGIALSNPITDADVEFLSSTKISDPLKNAILQQYFEYPAEVITEQIDARAEVCRMKRERSTHDANSLIESLTPSLQRSMELAQENGASI